MESKGRGGRNTHKKNSSSQIFVRRNPKKKRSKTQESDVFSRQGPKKRPKKQSLGKKNETREEEAGRSHFTRATNNFIIMALRQTLKQFTSKTTAFAPLLSRASGVQMYSTVIEGLKYASSHEWYVSTNSFSQSLFWANFRFGFSFCVVREHIFLFSFSLFCFLIPS